MTSKRCSGQTRREAGTQSQGSHRMRDGPAASFGFDSLASDTEVALHMSRPDASRLCGRMSWKAPTRLLVSSITALLVSLAVAPAALAGWAPHIGQRRAGVSLGGGTRAVRAAGGTPAARLPLIGALGARLNAGAAARLSR